MEEHNAAKKQHLLGIVLFCGFLLTIAAGYLLPKSDFSEMEKRYLAEAPDFSAKAIFSGDWSSQAEDYLSDHVPGRNLFVGVHAYLELFAGRQHLSDIWVEQGKLLEAPAAVDEGAIVRNMKAINAFADTVGQEVCLMVVPSAGWAAGVEGYADGDIIEKAYRLAVENVTPVPVEHLFAGRPELYYNTDHHWTSQGAYYAYEAFARSLDRDYRRSEDFTVTVAEDFQGSTYSRSALWLTPAETIELWQGSEHLTVTNGESQEVHKGIFYLDRLEEADKYTVFLDGNHSIVRVRNPEKQGRLLVIRDSYSNCLGGFLAESYGEVVLVDLRYYRQSISGLVQQEGFDDILVCYNCANFISDTNLMLLR